MPERLGLGATGLVFFEFLGSLIRFGGLLLAPQFLQHKPAAVVSVGTARFEFYHAIIGGQRLFEARQLLQAATAVVPRIGVVRCEFERAIECLQRLAMSVEPGEDFSRF